MSLNKLNNNVLISLPRKALRHYFATAQELTIDENVIPDELKIERATFITLHTADRKLRGCIGKLLAVQPLYKDVIENTYSAAFHDPRFQPLSEEELDDIKIEISILSSPKKLKYKDSSDLLEKLEKTKPGVILKKGILHATFLPQVWDDLPSPEDFLSHLSMKAGLSSDAWKDDNCEIEMYDVEKIKEE